MSVPRTDGTCPSDRFAELTLGTCLACAPQTLIEDAPVGRGYKLSPSGLHLGRVFLQSLGDE